MNTNAKFIVFEGIDGAGKTTQIQLLASALEKRGIKCNVSAEPTKLPIGVKIREKLSGKVESTPIEMAELFAADRAMHNTHPECGINKLLADGITAISDRYYYSSMAYQGAYIGLDKVMELNLGNPDIRHPDLCIFLDLTPEKSLERINSAGRETTEIYETYEILEETRNKFFDILGKMEALGDRIVKIDASGTVEEVAEKILSAVLEIY